jgi:hypothetical protein
MEALCTNAVNAKICKFATDNGTVRGCAPKRLPHTRESCARSLCNACMVKYRIRCSLKILFAQKENKFSY